MTELKAVLFDLHGTIAYREDRVTADEISDYLLSRGYDVSPQQLRAAWSFVAFVDYPQHGYRCWHTFFSRILQRLKVDADEETLATVARLLESDPYKLYPDAYSSVKEAKTHGFKTAIVTTIAHLQFSRAIRPIRRYFDFVMTGYEAGCDKSNPRMYSKVLEILRVAPSEAVMIGDDMNLDVLLPRRLGINAMLLDREKKSKRRLVDASVHNLHEAMKIIIGSNDRSSRN